MLLLVKCDASHTHQYRKGFIIMKTNDLAEIYLHSIEARGVREVTLVKYEWELAHFLANFGERNVNDIEFSELINWLRNLRQDDGTRFAHASLAGISKGLRYFFKFALEKGYIQINVAANLPRYSQKPVKRLAAPETDVVKILNSLTDFVDQRGRALRDLRDALIVSFAISTGARLRNITELERDAVVQALESPTVIYGPNVSYVYHLSAEGKGDKMLELRFSQSTADLFAEYLARTAHIASHRVFLTDNHNAKPASRYVINDAFRRVCAFAGTKTWLSHSIRKANVMAILDNGGDLKTAAGYAQHSDTAITLQHYVYSSTKRIDSAAATMDRRRQEEAQLMREMSKLFKNSR